MCCIFARMIEATATPSYQELLQQSIQQKQIIEILRKDMSDCLNIVDSGIELLEITL